MSNNFTFLGMDSEYEKSKIVVFGAGYDGTVSYRPGTRFAPNEMRMESDGLETYSPYLELDLEDINIFDGGNLELPFGSKERTLEIISEYVKKLCKDNKIPILIGGEHLVTLPVVKEMFIKYNDLHIIQFDAHADLRDDYMGEKLSHATVIRRIWDTIGDRRIHQFGIRSGTKEEFEFAKQHTQINKFNCNGLDEVVKQLKDKPVYITIDLDILDPSAMPGTGTPEPGGITFNQMMEAFMALHKLENIVGMDIVELSPHYDHSGISTAAACKILREAVLICSTIKECF